MKKPVIAAALLLVGVLGLAACAPQQGTVAAQTGAEDPVDTATFSWSYDSDCSTCHQAEPASLEDASCLAGTHAMEQGNTCQTCHNDEAGLAKAHEKDATPENAQKRATKLRSTKIDENACLACHGSKDELATKTADSALLTDAQGTTINPHQLPGNPEHEDTDCSSCHAMHDTTPIDESAPDYCESCHHANVYECHTCHS